MLCV
jgi:hypothetical protein